ncbi:hypothetical protein BOTBODRAFT_474277 [Botryobasidium botryosum FD-172 SS1]|uniref:Uncharacterized protein n=1 Tax=Botryobasidium botryosum (strain FD-172 SS1) TaxID=930990 RepID=A0A067M510_BOTB1|nr:hypothetical protein BOTBODRAFT_474277 [Botryobasidium botryosum FD-172 SS1]
MRATAHPSPRQSREFSRLFFSPTAYRFVCAFTMAHGTSLLRDPTSQQPQLRSRLQLCVRPFVLRLSTWLELSRG